MTIHFCFSWLSQSKKSLYGAIHNGKCLLDSSMTGPCALFETHVYWRSKNKTKRNQKFRVLYIYTEKKEPEYKKFQKNANRLGLLTTGS